MKQFLTVLALLGLALPLAAQSQPAQPFGEKIDVNAVLVDAIVTDANGHQILGLGPRDFVIKENGVPQTIDSVDYFTNRRMLDAREENSGLNINHVREERYYILFFDKPSDNQMFDQVALARNAARDWVKNNLQPADKVAVIAHDVRLKVFSDFTSDHAQLERALADVATFGKGLSTSQAGDEPSILRHLDQKKMMSKSGTVYEALTLLGDAVRPIHARKDMILISPGIHEPGETIRGGVILNKSRFYAPMVQALNAANVTVYPVQLMKDAPSIPLVHQNLESVAADTNGEYFRFTTNFTPALTKIEEQTNGYYLITYRASHAGGAKGYQKIQVAARNPEFRIKAREGYVFGE